MLIYYITQIEDVWVCHDVIIMLGHKRVRDKKVQPEGGEKL
jgi:hypothetical protein